MQKCACSSLYVAAPQCHGACECCSLRGNVLLRDTRAPAVAGPAQGLPLSPHTLPPTTSLLSRFVPARSSLPDHPGARCCWRGRRPVLPVLRALSGPALAGGIKTRDDNLNMRTSRSCFQNAVLAISRRARLQTQKVFRADILIDPNRYSNRSKHISKHINTYL